ncbi:Dabb family protein [Aureitalea marina]|uniref:Stress-response A/B barrel domain-containing protein n=1 Tax=Aureitalea marina TaxID=930804 RepID=A0A2S7KQ86_9FLAO|nr:Dabb family protein [Aureitalea marina]PQB04767.1 hypothetical protein BST85_07565 [Aureitalea marina]
MPKPLDIGLEHQVYLAINDSSMQEEVIDQLMTLKQVEGVEAVEVFSRLDVGDERALDYDLLLRVYFKDEKALAQYDSDSLHQSVRNQLKPHLSKPPLTFDLRFQD